MRAQRDKGATFRALHERDDVLHVQPPAGDVLDGDQIDVVHLRGRRVLADGAQHAGHFRQQTRSGIGLEKIPVMARAMRLVAVRHLQRAVEGIGVRARQHGERGEALWIAVGDAPGDARSPGAHH